MVLVVLTLLVCLLLSAAIAVYVAYPSRGRPLPVPLTSLRAAPRLFAVRRPRAGRSRLPGTAETAPEGVRG